VCNDGVALIAGKVKGFKTKVLELIPEIRYDHCFTRCEVIVARLYLPFLRVCWRNL
jgi:hypothetical protein